MHVPIMIFDDNSELAQAWSYFLELEGMRVSVAGSASRVLEILRTGVHPRLTLIDLFLPAGELNSFADGVRREFPVLLGKSWFVGMGFAGLPHGPHGLGDILDECIDKPELLDDLLLLVRRRLAEPRN